MSLISPLLKEIAIDGILLSRLRARAKAKAVGLGFYALAGLLAAVGIAFLIYAGFLALETVYTPLEAALWAGGVMLALAVILAVVTGVVLKRRQMRRQADTEHMMTMVQTLIETVETEISEPVQDNPKTALLLAGMAGLFARNYIR